MNAPNRETHFKRLVVVMTATVSILAAAEAVTAGEVYKSVDSKGRVTYSDQPSPTAKRVELPRAASRATAPERERISKQMESFAQADAARTQRQAEEEKAKAEKKAADERRKEMCKRARDRYLNFSEARRPYKRDEQGNRVYYSSAEIDAEKAASKKEMDLQCAEQ